MVCLNLRPDSSPFRQCSGRKNTAVETASAFNMPTNRFDVIRLLCQVHNDAMPSSRRRRNDMEDPEAMAADPFGGAHVPLLLVGYRRPVRERRAQI